MQTLFNFILILTLPFLFFMIIKHNEYPLYFHEFIFAVLTMLLIITSFQFYKSLRTKIGEKINILLYMLVFQISLIIFYVMTSVQDLNTKIYFIIFLSIPVLTNLIEFIKLFSYKKQQNDIQTELNNI